MTVGSCCSIQSLPYDAMTSRVRSRKDEMKCTRGDLPSGFEGVLVSEKVGSTKV